MWDWMRDNDQTLAGYTLLALFILATGAIVHQLNDWRGVYAWIRTRPYLWAREAWGKYAYPLRLYRKWKRSREKRVAELKALNRFWTDIICQAGESAVHAGQFSREQITESYHSFGAKAGLTGLLPKNITVTRKDMRDLKGAILKRIGPEARQAFKEKKNGKTKRWSAKIIRSQFRRAFRNAA